MSQDAADLEIDRMEAIAAHFEELRRIA